MLTVLEDQIREAVVKGDWHAYIALFNQWANLHNGVVPPERLYQVFVKHIAGSPILNLLSPLPKVEDKNNHPIVLILDHLLSACYDILDYDWIEMLRQSKPCQTEYASSFSYHDSLYEWVMLNRVPCLLENPVIKRMKLTEEMRFCFQEGNLERLRKLYDENKSLLRRTKVDLIESFFRKLGNFSIYKEASSPKWTLILSLIEHHEITVLRLRIICKENTSELLKTTAYLLLHSIVNCEKSDDLVYIYFLLIKHFREVADKAEISDLATSLFYFCCIKWLGRDFVEDEVTKQNKERIFLLLLTHGAKIPVNDMLGGKALICFYFLIKNKMKRALACSSLGKFFQHLDIDEQKKLIWKCFKYNLVDALDLFCRLMTPPAHCLLEFSQFDQKLSSLLMMLEKPPSFAETIQMFGSFLKYDLVSGLVFQEGEREIKHDKYHTDNFVKAIKGYSPLKAGWLKPIRDTELLMMYSLAKSTWQNAKKEESINDDLSAMSLNESLRPVQVFMQGRRDITKVILREYGGEGIPQTRKEITMTRLQNLAAAQLSKQTKN